MNWIVDSLESLKNYLIDKAVIYAPTGDQVIAYNKIDKNSIINLSRNSDYSARELFQPRTHYYIKNSSESDNEFNSFDLSQRVILGMRPCDIKGLLIFESVFGSSDMINELLGSTTIIGYLCETSGENCFCEATGISPNSTQRMDLVLYKVDKHYVITAKTEKGHKLFEDSPFIEEKYPVPHKYISRQNNKACFKELDKFDDISEKEWRNITFSCVNCRICTYVCPTCHCFSITDEAYKHEKGRAVVWDSCQSKYFTKEASGMNPRAEKVARAKNRMLHKLKYFKVQNGEIMCSGCGRCVSQCPSKLNLFEEIVRLKI